MSTGSAEVQILKISGTDLLENFDMQLSKFWKKVKLK